MNIPCSKYESLSNSKLYSLKKKKNIYMINEFKV